MSRDTITAIESAVKEGRCHCSCNEVSKTYTIITTGGKPRGNPTNDRSHLSAFWDNDHGSHPHFQQYLQQRGMQKVNTIISQCLVHVRLGGKMMMDDGGRATLTSQFRQEGLTSMIATMAMNGSADRLPPPRYTSKIPGSFLACLLRAEESRTCRIGKN